MTFFKLISNKLRSYYALEKEYNNSNYFTCQLGLNIDTNFLTSRRGCKALSFYKIENVYKNIGAPIFSDKLAFVSIPEDATVFDGDGVYDNIEADKIIIEKIIDFKDWEMWKNEEFCMKAIWTGNAFIYMKNQSEAICLAGLKINWWAIEFIDNKTLNVCLEAVKQNPKALKYIKDKTLNVCLEAVKHNPKALKYISDKTIFMCCLKSIDHNRVSCEFVNECLQNLK